MTSHLALATVWGEKDFHIGNDTSPVSIKFAWILSLLFTICLEKCKLAHIDEEEIYFLGPQIIDDEWYNLLMVDMWEKTSPARICGFFKYQKTGLPTK